MINRSVFLMVLEAEVWDQMPARPGSGKEPLQAAEGWLLVVPSRGESREGSKPSPQAYKGKDFIIEGSTLLTSLNPIYSPKAPPPSTALHWVSTYDMSGDVNIHSGSLQLPPRWGLRLSETKARESGRLLGGCHWEGLAAPTRRAVKENSRINKVQDAPVPQLSAYSQLLLWDDSPFRGRS